MPSLVERTREVVAAEADDFFQAETILYYLNKTQQKIVSFMVKGEQEADKSLRALDSLRQYKDISTDLLTFTDQGNYFAAEVEFPVSPDVINQFMFVKFDQRTVMRELTQNNRIKLEWGNLRPTEYESYYMITQDSNDNTIFEIFTNSDESGNAKDLRVYYVLNPTDLLIGDSAMDEVPNRLENALVYGAAKMMVSQEAVNDQNAQNAVQLFQQQYQEELQANAY